MSQDIVSVIWKTVIEDLLVNGNNATPRGMLTKELLCRTTCIPIRKPVLSLKARSLGYKFMCAEAAWILSGDNRYETIAPYSKDIGNFSDDQLYFAGAYGPQVIEQIAYVTQSLAKDQDTRQAVMTIWRQNPRDSKDVPCTVSVQWLIRNGKIHCIDTMRSSDMWLGWPYDIFNFSMLTCFIALILKHKYKIDLELGELYLVAGSQHIYERNFKTYREKVAKINAHECWYYDSIDLSSFSCPKDLVTHLWALANRDKMNYKSNFLVQMMEDVYASEY